MSSNPGEPLGKRNRGAAPGGRGQIRKGLQGTGIGVGKSRIWQKTEISAAKAKGSLPKSENSKLDGSLGRRARACIPKD